MSSLLICVDCLLPAENLRCGPLNFTQIYTLAIPPVIELLFCVFFISMTWKSRRYVVFNFKCSGNKLSVSVPFLATVPFMISTAICYDDRLMDSLVGRTYCWPQMVLCILFWRWSTFYRM
jgi:hypothetical protein